VHHCSAGGESRRGGRCARGAIAAPDVPGDLARPAIRGAEFDPATAASDRGTWWPGVGAGSVIGPAGPEEVPITPGGGGGSVERSQAPPAVVTRLQLSDEGGPLDGGRLARLVLVRPDRVVSGVGCAFLDSGERCPVGQTVTVRRSALNGRRPRGQQPAVSSITPRWGWPPANCVHDAFEAARARGGGRGGVP